MNNKYIMIMVALLALFLMVMPVSAVAVGTIVDQGATVFIGEEGLDIREAANTTGGVNTIGWWASAADIIGTSPTTTITVSGRAQTFEVTQSEFSGYSGSWYRINPSTGQSYNPAQLAFTVTEPRLSVSIRNNNTLAGVDGDTIVVGTPLTFKIDTNIILNSKRGTVDGATKYAPIADFAISSRNSITGEVILVDLSGGSDVITRVWKVDGVEKGNAATLTLTYVDSDAHTVTLIVNNSVNPSGKSQVSRDLTVSKPVAYNGSVTVGTIPPTTDPIASLSGVVNGDGSVTYTISGSTAIPPLTHLLEFGDGKNTTVVGTTPAPISHTYDSIPGDYTVALRTTNNASTQVAISAATHIADAPFVATLSPQSGYIAPNPAHTLTLGTTGYINILVKSPDGTVYSSVRNMANNPASLKNQFILTVPFYWNDVETSGIDAWKTDAKDSSGQRVYQNGVYTVSVESDLNEMKDNYKATGKTVSEVQTVTLGSDTLRLDINKASVVRGNSFSVTLAGQPTQKYNVYLKSINPTDQYAPRFIGSQEGVDPIAGSYSGSVITTDSSGSRVIGFTTSGDTKEQKYTIRAELDSQKYDEVTINVVKGGLTLVAEGDQSYYLGEEITLSGTNTETDDVYFFVVGPNLFSSGAKLDEPNRASKTNDDATFSHESVDADNGYTYDWQTARVDLDAGTYTIYAVSKPFNKNDLNNTVSYATTSVIIKKPYVSASVSQPTIAKGDRVYVEGIAEGKPASVAIWILGKNYATRETQTIDSDGTYKYEMGYGMTADMASGQYFIVVQHPMQNNNFDVYWDGSESYVYLLDPTESSPRSIFTIVGYGSLQGSDAAEALIKAIDNPNIDDTYTKLNVVVAEPLIAIDTIADKHIGDKFTITGKTNLAVDDEILIEVYSSSFKPTEKSQSGEFSGTTGNVKVVKPNGTASGLNSFSIDVDSSSFKVDEYIVVAQGIIQDATGTALFNVISGASTPAPTATPSVVVTAPVSVVTAIPTVPPTAVPTTIAPTPTPTSPGFGAVFALAGLLGVAFIVMRRQ